MSISTRRVRAIFRKELREYRHNGNIIYAMAVLPLIFLIQPIIQVFTLPSSASGALHHEHSLVYMLAIPALVPAALSAYSIVGERLQGTLEPLLSTPVRREELLLGKALAAFVPAGRRRLRRLCRLHRHRRAVRSGGHSVRPGQRTRSDRPGGLHPAVGGVVHLGGYRGFRPIPATPARQGSSRSSSASPPWP